MTNRQDPGTSRELSQLGTGSIAYTPGPYADAEVLLYAFDQDYLSEWHAWNVKGRFIAVQCATTQGFLVISQFAKPVRWRIGVVMVNNSCHRHDRFRYLNDAGLYFTFYV